jgi:cellulose biosynthesis protein BcsQ
MLTKLYKSICANACSSQNPQSNIEQINIDFCDDLIAKENDTLNLEVKRLEQKVKMLEKQAKVRHPQDNHINMVNKLEKRSNFTKQASQELNKVQPLKRQQKGIEDKKIKYARSAYLNVRMSHIKNDIDYKIGDKHNSRVNTKGQKFIKFIKVNVQ